MGSVDSFKAKGTLEVGGQSYEIYRLAGVDGQETLPYSLKVLLENLLRTEDGANITADHIRAIGSWDENAEPSTEIQFTPARVIMQDFTGVPCVVDLATMREAVADLGGDPARINPLAPAELVIDHSVIIDVFGRADAFERNVEIEYQRNRERYQFLRWGQTAFDDFKVVPPGTGIVHQVNIEHLARTVMVREIDGERVAYPDTCVGTDSHTTMVNGLGVLGWGVGGIEAEAAMLGQPVSMLIPRVVGFKLSGTDPDRRHGDRRRPHDHRDAAQARRRRQVRRVLRRGRLAGAARQPRHHRQHEPRVRLDVRDLPDRRRHARLPAPHRSVRRERRPRRGVRQGAGHVAQGRSRPARVPLQRVPRARPVDRRPLDRRPEASAGPHRAQRRQGRVPQGAADLRRARRGRLGRRRVLPGQRPGRRRRGRRSRSTAATNGRPSKKVSVTDAEGREFEIDHGIVSIASITSCTNTSNPSVMMAAAMLAKNAVEKGLSVAPWVKTSMAPGSKVVTGYYEKAGMWPYLEKLGFHLVGYGCTTCIGNSGPLNEEISKAINDNDLAVTSVLSGNRNFEGRINPDVKMNYLASPPLVIAYALAGTMDFDFASQPLGQDTDGKDVFLEDIWPAPADVERTIAGSISQEMFTEDYADVFAGDERWQSLPTPEGDTFAWDGESTYVRKPPYFDGMSMDTTPVADIEGARVLAKLGDSVTTDHISPAGAIKNDSPAGKYLADHGIERKDFNSYGSRRGNHEVMIRGTFANIRLKNLLLDGVEGGFTRDFTNGGEQSTIYDAAQSYAAAGTPLVILSGKEYGSGSSRDWAAKGTSLLGVKAVIAESYERIHRSNLIGMGVIPLQYPAGQNADSLGLDGTETFSITGITALNEGTTPKTVKVVATKESGETVEFDAVVRIDTPGEADYYRNGGILQYVLRSLVNS